MNKQRFLAELAQLLSFMAEHDRAAFLKQLNAKFDEAGPDGEAALIAQLGTPTALAINMSRSYTPTAAPENEDTGEPEQTAAEAGSEEAEEQKTEQDTEEEKKEPEQPAETESRKETEQPAVKEPEPETEAEKPTLSDLFGGENPALEADPEPEKDVKASRGRGALVTLTIAGGIMMLCVLLAVCAVIFAPGLGGLGTAVFAFLAGLWASPVFTDALFLFGIAAIALALGVFLLFLAIWLIVVIVKPLISGTAYLFKITGGEGK